MPTRTVSPLSLTLIPPPPSTPPSLAQVLLDFGADVNAVRTCDGVTPLMLAAQLGDSVEVCRLLDCGADPYARSYVEGFTALHVAAGNGHILAVRALVRVGRLMFLCGYTRGMGVVCGVCVVDGVDRWLSRVYHPVPSPSWVLHTRHSHDPPCTPTPTPHTTLTQIATYAHVAFTRDTLMHLPPPLAHPHTPH
jgi:hypothetical protein